MSEHWSVVSSVVETDPVGSASFGRIRIVIEKTDPEQIQVSSIKDCQNNGDKKNVKDFLLDL